MKFLYLLFFVIYTGFAFGQMSESEIRNHISKEENKVNLSSSLRPSSSNSSTLSNQSAEKIQLDLKEMKGQKLKIENALHQMPAADKNDSNSHFVKLNLALKRLIVQIEEREKALNHPAYHGKK
jgi:hypothetical protein